MNRLFKLHSLSTYPRYQNFTKMFAPTRSDPTLSKLAERIVRSGYDSKHTLVKRAEIGRKARRRDGIILMFNKRIDEREKGSARFVLRALKHHVPATPIEGSIETTIERKRNRSGNVVWRLIRCLNSTCCFKRFHCFHIKVKSPVRRFVGAEGRIFSAIFRRSFRAK